MRLFALISFIALFVLSVSSQNQNQMMDGLGSARQDFDSNIPNRGNNGNQNGGENDNQDGGNIDVGGINDAPIDDVIITPPPQRGSQNQGSEGITRRGQGSSERGQGSSGRGQYQGGSIRDSGNDQYQGNSGNGKYQSGYQRPPPQYTPPTSNICNPVTGLRAQNGGIYANLLSRMGVQGGNCGGSRPSGSSQGGLVNPITGLRAREGGIYATLLNAAGVSGTESGEGIGLFGGNPLVQLINARGGVLATAEDQTNLAAAGPAPMPAWAIGGIVLLALVGVAFVVVIVQLGLLIRRS